MYSIIELFHKSFIKYFLKKKYPQTMYFKNL